MNRPTTQGLWDFGTLGLWGFGSLGLVWMENNPTFIFHGAGSVNVLSSILTRCLTWEFRIDDPQGFWGGSLTSPTKHELSPMESLAHIRFDKDADLTDHLSPHDS